MPVSSLVRTMRQHSSTEPAPPTSMATRLPAFMAAMQMAMCVVQLVMTTHASISSRATTRL